MRRPLLLTYRFFALSVILHLSLSTTGAKRVDNPVSDHLVPNAGVLVPRYLKLLQKKLYLTAADYGRIAILPSAATIGETVISLHSDGLAPASIVLTCTNAASNLWSEAHALDVDLSREPDVKVHRADVRIPHALAANIGEAIEGLLDDIQESGITDKIVVDGTDFLVSIDSVRARNRYGVLRPDATGKRSAALRRLAFLLSKYCSAKQADRAQLEKSIDRELRGLKR